MSKLWSLTVNEFLEEKEIEWVEPAQEEEEEEDWGNFFGNLELERVVWGNGEKWREETADKEAAASMRENQRNSYGLLLVPFSLGCRIYLSGAIRGLSSCSDKLLRGNIARYNIFAIEDEIPPRQIILYSRCRFAGSYVAKLFFFFFKKKRKSQIIFFPLS